MQYRIFYLFAVTLVSACHYTSSKTEEIVTAQTSPKPSHDSLKLPLPYTTKSVFNFATVIGWPTGKTPQAQPGFNITKISDSLNNPRWMYEGPNGDLFVSEATIDPVVLKKFLSTISPKYKSMNFGNSANRISLFRDTNGDGIYDLKTIFLQGLEQPFGMLIIGKKFYVANTNGIMVFPYEAGQLHISSPGKKILDLPAGGYNNHWTRNIIVNRDSSKIYISVGSGTNIAEHGMKNEEGRACILEINPDGSGKKIFADGLRNPVGLAWAPETETLWTAVNERDELGDELVPDYLTSVQRNG
ncbi:MAG TPA: sorbosone dehydrogenase family protein, partial [Chitinophagaceae bacterium]